MLLQSKFKLYGNEVEIWHQDKDQIEVPKLGIIALRKLQGSSQALRDPEINQIVLAIKNHDKFMYNNFLAQLIKKQLILILEREPQLIASKYFRIIIVLSMEEKGGEYIQSDSRHFGDYSDAYIKLCFTSKNIHYMLFWNGIVEVLTHELTHHMDIFRIQKRDSIDFKLYERLNKKNSILPHNLRLIFFIFNRLREEGIASFNEYFKVRRRTTIDIKYYVKPFLETLYKICTNFNQEIIEDIYKVARGLKGTLYQCGETLVTIIIINELFKKNFKFSVWIEPMTLFNFSSFGISGKTYNADQIAKYFDKYLLLVHFTDKAVERVINDKLAALKHMNHIQFLQEYEAACKNLNIKNPILNGDSYHYFATLCLYNYKRMVLKVADDPKLERQLSKFKKPQI